MCGQQVSYQRFKVLQSNDPLCRRFGCGATIPPEGAYPGLPQAHCPRCGKITMFADEDCLDFREPIYPRTGIAVLIGWLGEKLLNW